MSNKIRITYLEVTYLEDTLGFHELMRHILSQPDFQVFTLVAEKANVEEIVATSPDLIIEDLRRRESPNLTLHRKIIMSDDLNRLPVLVITEKGYDSTPLGFEIAFLDDYVCYPLFDEFVFLSRVQDLLRRAETKT